MKHLMEGEGVCEGRHDESHRSSSQEEAPSVGVSEIAKRGGWTGGWGGMILGWGLGRRPLVAVLMALLSLTVMVRQASSLTCYTTKYTVRNLEKCDQLQHGLNRWYDHCILSSAQLPKCDDMIVSDGCPPAGILPCQYTSERDGEAGLLLDGSSHCGRADWNTCERGIEHCYKKIKARWRDGSISDWLIEKGCGSCSDTEFYSVADECDATMCNGKDLSGTIQPNGGWMPSCVTLARRSDATPLRGEQLITSLPFCLELLVSFFCCASVRCREEPSRARQMVVVRCNSIGETRGSLQRQEGRVTVWESTVCLFRPSDNLAVFSSVLSPRTRSNKRQT